MKKYFENVNRKTLMVTALVSAFILTTTVAYAAMTLSSGGIISDQTMTLGGTDVTHDATTTDFTINNSSFSPLTIRGTYTGTGSTHTIAGQNIEILLTPTDSSDYLVGSQNAVGSQGAGDSVYLIGSNANAYAQGTGHTTNIAAYIADAELQGSGATAGTLSDFSSYGVYVNAGASVTDAYSLWGHGQSIAGSVTNLYGVGLNSPSVSGTVTNAYAFWSGDYAGVATNPYYSWFDSRGVYRCKEDNTFNSVGQSICAVYNPQFTKYTPGAANYERIVSGQWNSNVAEIGVQAGGTGTLRDLRLIGANVDLPNIKLNGKLLTSTTSPTISSGFGTSPSVTASNGTATFRVNVGTGGSATTGVVGLPTATAGWNCFVTDITNPDSFVTRQTGSSVTTASFKNYSATAGTALAWTASDILAISCTAF